MTLTDILITVFDKSKPPLDDKEIKDSIFIINQYISILYPIAISEFNLMNISPKVQYLYWRSRLGRYKKIPPQLWVKSQKKTENKTNKTGISKETIKGYMSFYLLDKKDMEFLMKYPKTIETLIEIEKTKK